MMDTLFYTQEHLSCTHYVINVEEGFLMHEICSSKRDQIDITISNYILFVLEGSLKIDCGAYGIKILNEKQMLFIPKNLKVKSKCLKNGKLLVAAFNQIERNCDKLTYSALKKHIKNDIPQFDPIPINAPMCAFLDLIRVYLSNKINCAHIHKMKISEMLLCFRFFYSKEVLAGFFHPILGNSLDFKNLLLTLSCTSKNTRELIEKSNMSKTVFYQKFKEEFGDITPKSWLNQKKNELIMDVASNPSINVAELAEKTGFSTVQQLQQYCKRFLSSTPSEIIRSRKEILE